MANTKTKAYSTTAHKTKQQFLSKKYFKKKRILVAVKFDFRLEQHHHHIFFNT